MVVGAGSLLAASSATVDGDGGWLRRRMEEGRSGRLY